MEQPPQAANAQATERRGAVQVAPLWIMAPTTLCGLLFLILLDQRLKLNNGFSWAWVFFPLWLGDLYTLFIKSVEIRRIRANVELGTRRDTKMMLKPACGIVDTFGSFVSKILLAYYLDYLGVARMTLFAVMTPVWISAVISSCMRCSLPIARMSGRSMLRFRLPMLMGALYYILGRGIQPLLLVLKLEGAIHTDWRAVFVPAWILIFSEFLTATVLCHCAPVVHAATPRMVRTLAVRLMLLAGLQLYVMAICSFLFLYWLTDRLHTEDLGKKETVTVLQILSPLIAMSVLLIFIHPTMLYYSQQYQLTFRANLAEFAAVAEARGPNATGRTISLEATSTPTYLMQMSGTLYAPIADKSVSLADVALDPEELSMLTWDAPLTDESSDSKLEPVDGTGDLELGRTSPSGVVGLLNNITDDGADVCIICFTRTPNAVLMDCGHGGLCIDCARMVAQRNQGGCPVCRKRIRAVLQLTGFHELADGRVLAFSRDRFEVRDELPNDALI